MLGASRILDVEAETILGVIGVAWIIFVFATLAATMLGFDTWLTDEEPTHEEVCVDRLESEAGYNHFDIVQCRKDLELVDELRDKTQCS